MIYRRLFNLPTWGSRNMFNELESLRRRIDRAFDQTWQRPHRTVSAGVFPLINLTESKDDYYLRAELPGIKSDNLDIQVTGNNLSISGERKIEKEQDGIRYHRREREAGKFSRIISLPGDIDTSKVNASLTDGVLTVTIPKAEKAKPRQINIS